MLITWWSQLKEDMILLESVSLMLDKPSIGYNAIPILDDLLSWHGFIMVFMTFLSCIS